MRVLSSFHPRRVSHPSHPQSELFMLLLFLFTFPFRCVSFTLLHVRYLCVCLFVYMSVRHRCHVSVICLFTLHSMSVSATWALVSRVDIHSPIYVCLLGFGASVTGAPAREGMLLCLESVWRTACVRWSCARVWRPTYTRWLCVWRPTYTRWLCVWRPTYTRWLCVWRICSMCIVSALGGECPLWLYQPHPFHKSGYGVTVDGVTGFINVPLLSPNSNNNLR